MVSLTPEDREVLAEVLSVVAGDFTRYSSDAHPDHNRWSWRGNGHGSSMREDVYRSVAELSSTVEQIVARHVAAALNEAAEAMSAAVPTWHRGMYGCPDDMFARRDLARIVRNLAANNGP